MYLTEILFKEDTKFMKFNRSHILLISLISIFLLLSIGAASAANDAAIASDMAIDDITEVEDIDNNIKDVEILSQGDEDSVSDDPDPSGDEGGDGDESEPISTTIEAENKTFSYGSDIKVNFTLKDNESDTINNTNKSNFKVFYKNATDEEEFNRTLAFNLTDGSQFKFNQLPVGNYLLKIQFLNSTIGNKTYNESETIVSLNVTKTGTRINATDTKVKIGDDILIPLKLYVDSNKTLNANATRMQVIWNDVVYNCTNITGGDKVTNGIIIKDFPKEIGTYALTIKYLGNDNCNESEKEITLTILENNTMIITDNVTVDFEKHNVTVPIAVTDGVNNLTLYKENMTLVIVYDNGTENVTAEIADFEFSDNEGKYSVSFENASIPFTDAKLTIIYANGTFNETNKTLVFSAINNIITENTINVNNHTGNVTIPISINHTAKVTYDNKNITNVTVLNLTSGDIILVLTYNNGTENKTVNITSSQFAFSGDNGTYNVSFILNEIVESAESISFDNATVNIVYADGTLNETNKTVTLKEVIDLTITPITVVNDFQDGYFVFNVTDSVTGEPIANTNITASGLWFYTFGDTSSLSGSKTFTTDENGILRIKNENMHPNLDITGYSAGFVALPVGSYNLTFKASGSLALDNKTEITVNKVQAKIIAVNAVGEFGTITTYSFQVVNSKTNEPIKIINAIFRIKAGDLDATRSGATNKTGYYTSPNLNLTANKYNLQLSVNSTNVICAAVNKTLTINKRDAVINVNSRTVYYGAEDDIVATVKDKKTGKVLPNTYVLVKLYTTAKKYINFAAATNKKGVLTFSPPNNLNVGKHKFIISVLDNNYKSTTYTRYVTVKKAYGYFKLSNVKTYYRSGKLFKIRLVNKKTKKGIYGAKTLVKVYISKKKYYKYAANTTHNGILQFKINYKPGTYKVVVSNNGDKGYSAKSVTKKIRVTKHPLRFKAVSLKVKKGKYFKVKTISKKTKKALSAVKVQIKVYTGKKYKTYTKKSNKKGIASLKIKQKVGKHKVIVAVKYPKLYTAKKLKKTLRVRKK